MTLVEDELRRSLLELAGEGQPVDLGRAALAGARRRKRIRLGLAATAGAAAIVVALPVGLAGGTSPDEGDPVRPAGASQLVITYYLGGDPLAGYALDLETGEYQRDGVPPSSPDLRQRLTGDNSFAITIADNRRTRVPWPRPVGGAVWSPDGAYLAGTLADESGDVDMPPSLAGGVQVADLESGTGWVLPLDLPPEHRVAGLLWLDNRRLAIPVADPRTTVEVPPRYEWRTGSGTGSEGGGEFPVVNEVQVYTVDGTLEQRIAVDQGDYAASQDPGLLWSVGSVASEGTVVLHRHPDESTVELAAVTASGIAPAVALNLPEPPEGHYWRPAKVVFPLAGGRVLVAVELHREPPDGAQSDRWVRTEHYVADLANGQVRAADVPRLPDNGRPWVYGDAAGLPPAAQHRAFTP